jgi:hypothetical protein
MNGQRFLILALAMTACGAYAQVYKSIGPDGKVVYSDKPPESANSKSSVISTPAPASPPAAVREPARSPAASASITQEPAGTVPNKSRAKQAQRVDPPRNEAPAPTGPVADPALEKAVVGVMGIADLVVQMEDLCSRTLPTSFKKYNGAAAGWNQRNAAVVAQQRRVLSDAFDASQRQRLELAAKEKNQQTLAPVLTAPMASKIKWCDQSVDEINRGGMDVHNRPNLSSPLMGYRSKSG